MLQSKDQLILGLWQLSGHRFGQVKFDDAVHLILSAIQLGFTQFDTAYFYGQGQSFRYLKTILNFVHRSELRLIAKGGLRWKNGKVIHAACGDDLKRDLDDSLRLLGSDYLDDYFLHWPDPAIDITESLDALLYFKKEGLVNRIGVCNLPFDLYPKVLDCLGEFNCQIHYNPLHQDPVFEDDRVSYWAYSPFEQGLLLQDYRHLGKKDYRRVNRYFCSDHLALCRETLFEHAKQSGDEVSIWILKDILAHERIESVVVGLKRLELLTTISECL